MIQNKHDISGDDLMVGMSAEKNFKSIMESNGFIVIYASPEANKCLHIDTIIKGKLRDVYVDNKARKYRFRVYNWILAEFIGKNNNTGWIYGKQDLISFELNNDSVLIVKRKDFASLCEKLIKDVYVDRVEDSLYKKCKRVDGDVYGHIKFDDIKTNIQHVIISRKK